jgi:hypothetical protein
MAGRGYGYRSAKTIRPFTWPGFLGSLFVSAMIMFAFGLLTDNSLRLFGIGISAWKDALWDCVMALFFGSIVAPLFWRIGLVTFPQYLLGAFALVVPMTIVSALVLSRFHDVSIDVPGIDAAAFPNQSFAISAYVRLIRAVIYVPVFLASFYWIYHLALGMAPKGHEHG